MSAAETYDDLLAALLGETSRDAVEYAAAEPPADHVRAIPVRRLVAEAPALPPLKMPKLSDRTLNGRRVEELVAAGPRAALVHTTTGLRVVEDVATVADDPDVVVLASHREVYRAVTIAGEAPLTAAQRILDRELLAITKAAA